ncbi:MAG TPA: hypothetical protein PKA82_01990 [Pyrinomonadaceae bacterium]|nr:hypothetical protein [Pyrinomonadaceae bacterium]
MTHNASILRKLPTNLPWIVRYPFSRLRSRLEMTAFEKKQVVITVADHFEPAWNDGPFLDKKGQVEQLRKFHTMARETGNAVVDSDGTKFRHTNFYPAEQYDADILDIMAEMQVEGLGETEVHLHHGDPGTDTPEYLQNMLTDFRDTLAGRHKLLSRFDEDPDPKYAFVHGNLALGNSCKGKHCGVDNEFEILRDTGCYLDMTLPSAPDRSQVSMLNKIYEAGGDLSRPVPHRVGRRFEVGSSMPESPLLMTGPLVFYFPKRFGGMPLPRLDDGVLAANQPYSMSRFDRWMSANVTVAGRSDVVFIKLYCHGFFDYDQAHSIGEEAARFFGEIVERGAKTGKYSVHFTSAREAYNIAMAISQGKTGEVNQYRNFLLKPIMSS